MYFFNKLFVILFFTVLGQYQCEAQENVETPAWPDLTCREDFVGGEDEETVNWYDESCKLRSTLSPYTPGIDYYSEAGFCVKFCMLLKLNMIEENRNTEKYSVRKAAPDDDWYFLDVATTNKIHEQCSDLFETVFYGEQASCNSIRANDVYDCVQNALKC